MYGSLFAGWQNHHVTIGHAEPRPTGTVGRKAGKRTGASTETVDWTEIGRRACRLNVRASGNTSDERKLALGSAGYRALQKMRHSRRLRIDARIERGHGPILSGFDLTPNSYLWRAVCLTDQSLANWRRAPSPAYGMALRTDWIRFSRYCGRSEISEASFVRSWAPAHRGQAAVSCHWSNEKGGLDST